jgi:6-phospho-3-hexuloisomerase
MDLRDIGQQICREVAEAVSGVDESAARRLADAVARARCIFVGGTGRSGYVARCLAVRLTHLGLNVHVVGDATAPKVGQGDLVLVCSGSGRTPSILGYVQEARQAGAKVALITASPRSPAAKQAGVVIHLPAPTRKAGKSQGGTPRSIQPMGSLFEQTLLVFADAFVMILADRLHLTYEQMWQRHANLE